MPEPINKLFAYRMALAVSVAVDVLLIAAVSLSIHFAGLFDVVSEAVGFFN